MHLSDSAFQKSGHYHPLVTGLTNGQWARRFFGFHFFLVGHAFANLSPVLSFPIATDGYSWSYQASAAVFALIGE
jgi:hypothetical protein